MFKVPIPRKSIEKELNKLQPLNYNRFRWWRWYEHKNKPLPNKSSFRDKILNGDFEYSCYQWQAYLCEYMLNDLLEESKGDYQKYLENSAVLRARRKRLLEDFENDELSRLDNLYTQFTKNFNITKSQVEEEALKCLGETIDLYYIIEEKYKKEAKSPRRGRPKKLYK